MRDQWEREFDKVRVGMHLVEVLTGGSVILSIDDPAGGFFGTLRAKGEEIKGIYGETPEQVLVAMVKWWKEKDESPEPVKETCPEPVEEMAVDWDWRESKSIAVLKLAQESMRCLLYSIEYRGWEDDSSEEVNKVVSEIINAAVVKVQYERMKANPLEA